MKATLYAARSGSTGLWQWHTSICWDADAVYWRSRSEGEASLWLARPVLSFGQAEWLRRSFQARQLQVPRDSPPDIMSYVMSTTKQHPFPIPAIAGDFLPTPQNDGRNSARNGDIQKLLPALEGRHLLFNEAAALAEHHAPGGWSAERLAYVLQLGRLLGLLHLEPGIRVETSARQGWAKLAALQSLWSGERTNTFVCERCGSGETKLRWTDCPFCEHACPYCEDCLTMGRVRACSPLVIGGRHGGESRRDVAWSAPVLDMEVLLRPWGLSDAQAAASRAGLEFLAGAGKAGAFLIWAVTGAGKTEMIFPFLAAALAKGGKALVASPRKDVVLELSPRVERAFPEARIVTLYGGSEQRWDTGDIVIATTHQLMRFKEGFDVVVIDELDAFPYHNNPMLAHAARKSCKPDGRYILLSATPPSELKRSAARGYLPHVKVPARYHRHPLPIPQLQFSTTLKNMNQSRRLSRSFRIAFQNSLGRGAQLFVFVPSVAMVEPFAALMQEAAGTAIVRGTSSKDPDRAEKVRLFRDGAIRILVTTTILERGITVPKSDVIVVDADSRLFDESSLVQMAGRAGRSQLDPTGCVTFLAKDRTRSQTAAVRQIRSMNRLAKKMGYIG